MRAYALQAHAGHRLGARLRVVADECATREAAVEAVVAAAVEEVFED